MSDKPQIRVAAVTAISVLTLSMNPGQALAAPAPVAIAQTGTPTPGAGDPPPVPEPGPIDLGPLLGTGPVGAVVKGIITDIQKGVGDIFKPPKLPKRGPGPK
ncbi:hypothetical protein AB0G04_10475 [Actinoplanes sp. NPDC023801]|uniref:hypothetical protein n=1 Tax=Actinoplanes sp. NPDC023801 TaxID=3154595 RepID=UPI003409180E